MCHSRLHGNDNGRPERAGKWSPRFPGKEKRHKSRGRGAKPRPQKPGVAGPGTSAARPDPVCEKLRRGFSAVVRSPSAPRFGNRGSTVTRTGTESLVGFKVLLTWLVLSN